MINGDLTSRDYSISSSPNSGELNVTIKEIKNGLFSSYANKSLEKGDFLKVATPKGRFIFEPSKESSNTIVAFAAGSGITPIMSIIKTVLTETTSQKCILFYGNQTKNTTIFHKTLTELESHYRDRLKIHFIYSREKSPGHLNGRIDSKNTIHALKNIIPKKESCIYYLCGPERMIHNVKNTLSDYNISENKIFFELFTTTQSSEEKIIKKNIISTEATILFDDETESITILPEQTILEAALEKDLDVPYSCKGGVCSSCICRITEGTAEMRQNSILSESEVEEGLVLSCQAVPTSSKINIDFDDV
jgi:ring-1,2-phenylacetyl-CoA epoxidase subunit PaaE